MRKSFASRVVLAVSAIFLTSSFVGAAAQSKPKRPVAATQVVTGSDPEPQVVTGSDPEPQVVTGSDPEPQVVTGSDPEPQVVTGSDPEPQAK